MRAKAVSNLEHQVRTTWCWVQFLRCSRNSETSAAAGRLLSKQFIDFRLDYTTTHQRPHSAPLYSPAAPKNNTNDKIHPTHLNKRKHTVPTACTTHTDPVRSWVQPWVWVWVWVWVCTGHRDPYSPLLSVLSPASFCLCPIPAAIYIKSAVLCRAPYLLVCAYVVVCMWGSLSLRTNCVKSMPQPDKQTVAHK